MALRRWLRRQRRVRRVFGEVVSAGGGCFRGAAISLGVVGWRQMADEAIPAPVRSAAVSADTGVPVVGPTVVPSLAAAATDQLVIPAIEGGVWSLTRRDVEGQELVLAGDVHDATLCAGSSSTALLA